MNPTAPHLSRAQAAVLRSAGDRLRADGYNETDLPALLGVGEAPTPSPERLPFWLARAPEEVPLGCWIRLFLLRQAVSRSALARHLSSEALGEWCEAGLLQMEGKRVQAGVYLQAYRELLVASDFPPEGGWESRRDHVLGVNKSTRALSDFAVAPAGGTVLDLGCGGGTLALLGARSAEAVVGVDLNPRAVWFSQLNAALNRIANVDFRVGDCFVPVEGERFDRLVANPPFVISPETSFVYRDGGADGDEFCARLVRQAPRFLREGGYCQLLCNWAHVTGQDWRDRLSTWFAGSGCDVLVIRSQTVPVDEYAITWLTTHSLGSPTEHAERFDAWMRYYREEAIEAISLGLIALRRTASSTSQIHFLEGAVRMNGPCGGQVRNALNALPHLALPDDELLGQPLALDPECRVRLLCQPGEAGWRERMAWIERPRGLYHQETMGTELALALSRCNGRTPLSALGEVTARAESLRSIRSLLERGFFEIHSAAL